MSTLSQKLFGEFDEYLLQLWFDEFKSTRYSYREPILDSMTVELIKHLCDTLKQDSHVFVMSVDLLIQYITIQNNENTLIEDQLLVIVCIIFICSKHIGAQSDLRSPIISKLYTSITEKDVSTDTLMNTEMEIMGTLQCRLPLYSRLDDLKTFLTVYLKHFKLRVDILGLCVQILELVYIYYRRLFHKLKNLYKQNSDALQAFEGMITNRLYLPCGILLCALEMTKLKHFMNSQDILQELSEMCNIHKDHLELLSKYIYDIIRTSGHATKDT